jgi:hypothetical protein
MNREQLGMLAGIAIAAEVTALEVVKRPFAAHEIEKILLHCPFVLSNTGLS